MSNYLRCEECCVLIIYIDVNFIRGVVFVNYIKMFMCMYCFSYNYCFVIWKYFLLYIYLINFN